MDLTFSVQHVVDSLWLSAPLSILVFAALAVMVADLFLPRDHRGALGFISVAGLLMALAAHLAIGLPDGADAGPFGVRLFMGALSQSYLTFLAQAVILGGGVFLVLISPAYIERREAPQGEYYALLLFGVMAMAALAASTELLTLFLNIEMLSIILYILAGIEKHNLRSTEAAFKYFLLGSFAGGFLMMGIAFVFGATGQMRYDLIYDAMHSGQVREPIFLAIGLALMFVGFGFKLTLAPFHMYAPDVYEGSPTPVAGAIATIGKVAVLAAFFPLVQLAAGWDGLPRSVWAMLYVMAAASMIVGNIGAIVQPSLKRMLAYSSVAHSGYAIVPMVVLLGVGSTAAAGPIGVLARDATAYYMLAYTVMTLLAFGVAASIGPTGETRIANYAGLWRRNKWLSFVMLLSMLSLLGAPPTLGFIGKLQLFMTAVQGKHYILAVIGVLASVMSVYYYLRVVVTMFMQEPGEGGETTAKATPEGANLLALGVASACVFLFAVVPALYLFSGRP